MKKDIATYYDENGKLPRKVALAIMRKQLNSYRRGDRKRRTEILDNLVAVLHRPRKSIIRSMNRLLGYKEQNLAVRRKISKRIPLHLQRKRGRPYKYSKEVDAALDFIWGAYNFPYAERLLPEVEEAIRIFQRDEELKNIANQMDNE